MARYVVLANWTDQGARNIKDSPARLDAAKAMARSYGCEFKDFYMTAGGYDMVVIVEAPDDEAVAKVALTLASAGSVRTTTLKAYPEATYRALIAGLK